MRLFWRVLERFNATCIFIQWFFWAVVPVLATDQSLVVYTTAFRDFLTMRIIRIVARFQLFVILLQ